MHIPHPAVLVSKSKESFVMTCICYIDISLLYSSRKIASVPYQKNEKLDTKKNQKFFFLLIFPNENNTKEKYDNRYCYQAPINIHL